MQLFCTFFSDEYFDITNSVIIKYFGHTSEEDFLEICEYTIKKIQFFLEMTASNYSDSFVNIEYI
jgi:hypothetical protein